MKKFVVLVSALLCTQAFAGKDVHGTTVNYVYQLDEPGVFQFSSSVPNNCGSSLYRVKSVDEGVANRKFSLVLTAFTAGKKLSFHDSQVCEGNRSVVRWVRLIN